MRRKKTTIKDENKNGKRSRSQKYRRIAEKIRARKMSVLDNETGEYLLLSEGEEMVRCYDFKTFEEHEYHYVTSLGRVISLKGTRPHFLKLVANGNGYLKFGSGVFVHRAVWFSFAYDAIKNKRKMPSNYRLPENRKKAVANLRTAVQESDKYVVHHKDGDPQNNRLENLEGTYIGIHSMLHSPFDPKKGETETETDMRRLKMLYDRKDITEPSVFSADGIRSAEKLSPESAGKIDGLIRINAIADRVMKEVSRVCGSEYFREEKICVINDGSALHYFDVRDGADSDPIKRDEVVAPMPDYDILYDMPSGKISVSSGK